MLQDIMQSQKQVFDICINIKDEVKIFTMRSWQPCATLRTDQGQVLTCIDKARVTQINKPGKQQLQQTRVIKHTNNSYRQGKQRVLKQTNGKLR